MSTNSTLTTSKKVALTVTLPSINMPVLIERLHTLLSSVYDPVSNTFSSASENVSARSRRMRLPRMNNKFNFDKKYLKVILPILIGVVVIAAIVSVAKSLPDAQSKPSEANTQVGPNELTTLNLEKKLVFPLKDAKGATVGTFDYVIQSASLQKQIIVQGQRASAVEGRVFLILNLKIVNNLKKAIQLNTRDYIRLTTSSNSVEQLAPDIHNDPVEVQAISTKYTRVGIAINEEDAKKTIHLKIGEIDGSKENLDLNFKY